MIAYAVNIGGFGLMVGSLANLIALRMADDPQAWRSFHAWSLPFLLVAAAAGWWLLFGGARAATARTHRKATPLEQVVRTHR